MWRNAANSAFVMAVAILGSSPASAQGDVETGAQEYRICTACHSLEPGVHLTGPSLAGIWGSPAASVDGYSRYSDALKRADVTWDENTLNAWLADPQAMTPGTYMNFRGIDSEVRRENLVAFLSIILKPGGVDTAVERGLIEREGASGQVPPTLGEPEPAQVVTSIRHCGDAYRVATEDGAEFPYWEHNVRLKIDTSDRGPRDRPVLVHSGMMGDRISIVFSSLDHLTTTLQEGC